MSHLRLSGVSKRGYLISKLEAALSLELMADVVHRTVIVGAGNLGCALALHGDLADNGFDVCAVFDQDRKLIGKRVGKLAVRPVADLTKVVRAKHVDIGVIAVPAAAAQDVAEKMIAAGIRGLLNLAHVHIRVPRHVVVVEARILARLQEIAYALRAVSGTRP